MNTLGYGQISYPSAFYYLYNIYIHLTTINNNSNDNSFIKSCLDVF